MKEEWKEGRKPLKEAIDGRMEESEGKKEGSNGCQGIEQREGGRKPWKEGRKEVKKGGSRGRNE